MVHPYIHTTDGGGGCKPVQSYSTDNLVGDDSLGRMVPPMDSRDIGKWTGATYIK